MTAPKRMALAFCCILLAIAALGVFEITMIAIRQPSIWLVLAILILFSRDLLYALPGWFLALPFVFLFKDAEGPRAWLILIIGTAIGPACTVGWTLLTSQEAHIAWGKPGGAVIIMSFLIAFLTSVFYVLLLRYFARRRALVESDL